MMPKKDGQKGHPKMLIYMSHLNGKIWKRYIMIEVVV